MQLACNDVVRGLGCDYVAQGDDASEVHAAMMAHGDQVHSALMEGMKPDEMTVAKDKMDARILDLLGPPSG